MENIQKAQTSLQHVHYENLSKWTLAPTGRHLVLRRE
jgi:hypothetical protein